ncbi:MAG: hypothetical protein LH654_02250 [Thermoleophilia bacterium]|nr:hypothetical protein [Thermoleophilia bacterium]
MTVRERWFGSTGRKVPAIVLDGTMDVSAAIEIHDVTDAAALQAAHAAGTPVVVRASSVAEVAAALSRPEVSCVLVTDQELLTVDLANHTYG